MFRSDLYCGAGTAPGAEGYNRTRMVMRMLKAALVLLSAVGLQAEGFRAGAAVADVTPVRWPVPLVGSFSERLATKAWDPLEARALVLDDGETRLAMVLVDSCYVPREVFDEAKRRASEGSGIRTDRMLMAATHTHSAPPSKDSVLNKADADYVERLTAGLAEAVVKAAGRLEPAEIGWGRVDVPEEVFNRRWHMKPGGMAVNPFGKSDDRVRMNPPRASELLDRPAGPTDPEVLFLSVRKRTGEPVALVANYSLHYVGGVAAGGVSADYFGEFSRRITEELAPANAEFVGMMFNGTSGNINNIDFRKPRSQREPFEQIRHVAGRVAERVAGAYGRVEHRGRATLAMEQLELKVKLRRPSEGEMAWARTTLAEPDEEKLPRRAKAYAGMTLALAARPAVEVLVLQAVRIGEVGIATIPCEVFVEIGLELKKESPLRPSFVIELANGHYSYLPTPEQHELGGYETWMGTNILEVDASEKITAALLGLLRGVAGKN